MEINRTIRIQDDSISEKKEQVSSNNNTMQEGHKEISNKAYNALRECVKKVEEKKIPTNMIGVFGNNSDIIINNMLLNLSKWKSNYTFAGYMVYYNYVTDVYNSMAVIFYNYIAEHFNVWCYESTVEMLKEIYIKDPYGSKITPYRHDDSIRVENLLKAIEKISNMGPKHRFFVIIEMEWLDAHALECLSKLNSSALTIIVFSKLDYKSAKISLSNSMGAKFECMYTYFGRGNWVITEKNIT